MPTTPVLPPEGSSKEVYGTIEVSGAAVTISGGLGTDVHDEPAGTDVVLIGAYAADSVAGAVAHDDAVRVRADRWGRLYISGSLFRDEVINTNTERPLIIGGYASNAGGVPAAVGGNDAQFLACDLNGRLRTRIDADNGATFDHLRVVVGTTEVAVVGSPTTVERGVLVKAASTNTGIIYVGNSDVTAGGTAATDGFELTAGESVFIPTDDANKVHVIASAASQNVFVLYQ